MLAQSGVAEQRGQHGAHQRDGHADIGKSIIGQGQQQPQTKQGIDLAGNGLLKQLALMQSQCRHAARQRHCGQDEGQDGAGDQPVNGQRHDQSAGDDRNSGIVGQRLATQHFGPVAGPGDGQGHLFACDKREEATHIHNTHYHDASGDGAGAPRVRHLRVPPGPDELRVLLSPHWRPRAKASLNLGPPMAWRRVQRGLSGVSVNKVFRLLPNCVAIASNFIELPQSGLRGGA